MTSNTLSSRLRQPPPTEHALTRLSSTGQTWVTPRLANLLRAKRHPKPYRRSDQGSGWNRNPQAKPAAALWGGRPQNPAPPREVAYLLPGSIERINHTPVTHFEGCSGPYAQEGPPLSVSDIIPLTNFYTAHKPGGRAPYQPGRRSQSRVNRCTMESGTLTPPYVSRGQPLMEGVVPSPSPSARTKGIR